MTSLEEDIARLEQQMTRNKKHLEQLKFKKKNKQTMIITQFFPERIHRLEQSKHELHKALQQKQPLLLMKSKHDDYQSLVRVMKKGAQLKTKQKNNQLTPEEKTTLQTIQDYIKTKQQDLHLIPRGQLDIRKMAMKTYRIDVHTKKFPNNYYQFLTKQMMNPRVNTASDVIERFYTDKDQGLAYEALWSILISLGFCEKFNRREYDFYDAELKEPTETTSSYFITKIMTNAEYLQFLKHTRIKGVNGKSDITVRKKSDGKWVFISCKYYKSEKGDYDVPAIYRSIQETNEKYPHMIGNNYEIYVFANNKQDTQRILKGSRMAKTEINRHIQKDGAYHVLGVEDLESCFQHFKGTIKNMTADYFERMFLRRYSQLATLNLTLGQMPIVNATYNTILTKWKECEPPQNLKIYWKTLPQFGKTYCVGMLFLKLVKLFNAVIVVNRIDTLRNYSREVFGGHQQFVDNFNVIEIANEIPANKQEKRTFQQKLEQKLNKKLVKSVHKNNIIVVLKKHLGVVRSIPNLRYIVFDEYDDQSNTLFEDFTASPNKIGLFLTSSVDIQSKISVCEHVLSWTFEDQSLLQKIMKQIVVPKQQRQVQVQQQSRIQSSLQQLREDPYKRSLRIALSRRSTTQNILRCLQNSFNLTIASHYLNPMDKQYSDIFQIVKPFMSTRTTRRDGSIKFRSEKKVNNLLQEIENVLKRKTDRMAFTTQLWFLPDKNNLIISDILRNIMKNNDYFHSFDIVIDNEPDKKDNPHRHPNPIKDDFTRLISHYQTRAHSNYKKGLIFLLGANTDIKGVPLPNVDMVFSLNDEANTRLSYVMMSKCMTPKEDKQSVYYVDFNTDRVFDMLHRYFGENIQSIVKRKLVSLLDIDEPDLTSTEVAQNILTRKQDENIQQQQQQQAKPVLSTILQSEQQKRTVKSSKTPSSLNKFELIALAKDHKIPQEEYENLTKKDLFNLLRDSNIIQPRVYTKSSK